MIDKFLYDDKSQDEDYSHVSSPIIYVPFYIFPQILILIFI